MPGFRAWFCHQRLRDLEESASLLFLLRPGPVVTQVKALSASQGAGLRGCYHPLPDCLGAASGKEQTAQWNDTETLGRLPCQLPTAPQPQSATSCRDGRQRKQVDACPSNLGGRQVAS